MARPATMRLTSSLRMLGCSLHPITLRVRKLPNVLVPGRLHPRIMLRGLDQVDEADDRRLEAAHQLDVGDAAAAYSDQTERDFEALKKAIDRGRVAVETGM